MRVLSRPSDLSLSSDKILSDGRPTPEAGFSQVLQNSIGQVDQLQHQADQAMQEGSVQGAVRIDETMIKLEEADIGLRMLTKVRTKALEAYQEIMRMQF
ncbi:MAG: flagellar hook-basal body complex protein FliE [Syntrophobacteraceae bacterium]|jgi:flagellar hook-basal body complex protein FliE|nr:flagellar hook-basal body complex protein FliE [Syntrophobacteraceae bacterium]